MSTFTDGSWQEFVEMADHELTCRVLEAELAIATAERESAEDDLWFAEDPRRYEVHFNRPDKEEFFGTILGSYRDICGAERAAYGWRRDYGEWPSAFNLTDRLAMEAGISHRAARIRIQREVNDPSANHHLHIIRAKRLTEILNDEPHTCGPWVRYEDHVRFYVDAAGQERLASQYDVVTRLAAA